MQMQSDWLLLQPVFFLLPMVTVMLSLSESAGSLFTPARRKSRFFLLKLTFRFVREVKEHISNGIKGLAVF